MPLFRLKIVHQISNTLSRALTIPCDALVLFQVYVRFIIRSLTHFDMSNGQLETIGYMVAVWYDEKLAWTGTEFEQIPRIHLNSDDLWEPHIVQLNAMPEEVQLDSITLFSDGTVARFVVRKFFTFCELNMRFYPNDEHECKFEFLSIKYAADELSLIPDSDASDSLGVDVSLLNTHGEWSVKGTYVENRYTNINLGGIRAESIIYTLVLNRQPEFNVIHKFVPLAVLALSTLFTHIVPLKSGERISYSVTLLLAFIFWQAIVAEELPKNSSKISIFSFLVTALLFQSACFTIISVTLCRIADLDANRRIPRTLQALTRKFRAKVKVSEKLSRRDSMSDIYRSDNTDNRHYKQSHKYINGRPVTKSNGYTPRNVAKYVEDSRPVSWHEVANTMDKLLFVVHVTFALLASVAVILIFTLE